MLFKPRVSNPVEFHIADSDIAVTLTAGGFNTGISGFTGLNSTVSGTWGFATDFSATVTSIFWMTLGFIVANIPISLLGS